MYSVPRRDVYLSEGDVTRMQRTQIYLEPGLSSALDRLARKRGTSRAGMLRLAARRLIAEEQEPRDDPIFSIIAMGRGGASDVSERHDEYLARLELRKMSR
jgi:hypothetical protein